MNTQTTIAGVTFKNPVMTASGTLAPAWNMKNS